MTPRRKVLPEQDAGTPLCPTSPKNSDSLKCAAVGEPLPPEHVPTLARLADLFNMSTSAMRDLRARDPRFPPKGTQGYNVYAVAHLLRARELERQSDEDFQAEGREQTRARLREIESKVAPWHDFPPDVLAGVAEDLRAMLRGERDVDPATGRTRRELCLADALDALRDCIERDARATPAPAVAAAPAAGDPPRA